MTMLNAFRLPNRICVMLPGLVSKDSYTHGWMKLRVFLEMQGLSVKWLFAFQFYPHISPLHSGRCLDDLQPAEALEPALDTAHSSNVLRDESSKVVLRRLVYGDICFIR